MNRNYLVSLALLAGLAGAPQAVHAQYSPRGLLGAMTAPFRHMLGRPGHFPRGHQVDETRADPGRHAALSEYDGVPGWPNAFDDVLSYTFWPADYVRDVPSHGFAVIAKTIDQAPRGQPATTGAGSNEANAAETCGNSGAGGKNWLIDRIENTVKLTDPQRTALEKLRASLDQSIKKFDTTCEEEIAQSPIDRLSASIRRLWAVRDAGVYIRGPLQAFYDALSSDQKAAFDWQDPQQVTPQKNQPNTEAAGKGMNRQFQVCAGPGMVASEQMLKEIEKASGLHQDQTAAMDALRKSTTDMAKFLSASCGEAIAKDPLARLDAANAELSRLSYAATSEQIALNDFYGALDAGQKVKFDALGH